MFKKELINDQDFVDFCLESKALGHIQLPNYTKTQVENISGNINRVRRITFSGPEQTASYIVKTVPDSGRLERYPEIFFPENRIHFESAYYQLIAEQQKRHPEISYWLPTLYRYVPEVCSILIADLQPACTLESHILDKQAISSSCLQQLATALGHVHQCTLGIKNSLFTNHNPSMTKNLPFILELPFSQPDYIASLWPEDDPMTSIRHHLQQALLPQQASLVQAGHLLQSKLFSSDLTVLTHGDLHAQSIFIGAKHISVIDTELCDIAAPWFDVGILLAHLHLLSATIDKPFDEIQLLGPYMSAFPQADSNEFIQNTQQLMSFEILRRIVGPANFSALTCPHAAERLVAKALEHLMV